MRSLSLQMPSGPKLEINVSEQFIIPRMIERGGGLKGYEPDSFACTLACLMGTKGIFYDVGANVGIFSLLVSSVLKRKSVGFEPTPELADAFEQIVKDNDLPVEVRRLALSDKEGTANFFLSNRSDASNSLNGRFRKGSPSIEVEVSTFDAICSEVPTLIKIDVETAEAQVLAGASSTIEKHRPFVIAEVLTAAIGQQVNQFFEGRDYTMYHITPEAKWEPHSAIPEDFNSEERNWLFAPAPLPKRFWIRLDAWRWRISKA